MTLLITIIALGLLIGAYWLGWNDREWKAKEDDAFRRLDALFARLASQKERA